jgi:hypothetical protein
MRKLLIDHLHLKEDSDSDDVDVVDFEFDSINLYSLLNEYLTTTTTSSTNDNHNHENQIENENNNNKKKKKKKKRFSIDFLMSSKSNDSNNMILKNRHCSSPSCSCCYFIEYKLPFDLVKSLFINEEEEEEQQQQDTKENANHSDKFYDKFRHLIQKLKEFLLLQNQNHCNNKNEMILAVCDTFSQTFFDSIYDESLKAFAKITTTTTASSTTTLTNNQTELNDDLNIINNCSKTSSRSSCISIEQLACLDSSITSEHNW